MAARLLSTRLPITAAFAGKRGAPCLARFNSSTSASQAARLVEMASQAHKPSPLEASVPLSEAPETDRLGVRSPCCARTPGGGDRREPVVDVDLPRWPAVDDNDRITQTGTEGKRKDDEHQGHRTAG